MIGKEREKRKRNKNQHPHTRGNRIKLANNKIQYFSTCIKVFIYLSWKTNILR